MKRTLITNIGMLATPQGTAARGGRAQGEICILKNAWILIENDLIAQVGTSAAPAAADAQTINAGGKLVTPGLVDAHTHLIFGGWRQNELALKLHGAGYLDILAAGGGILSTMRATKAASEEQLEAKASAALDEMLRFGTTTAEAKSGYGLSTGEECKALRVIGNLQKHHVMDLAATFMGAHAVPEAYRDNRQGYLELLCEEMLPAVREQGIAEFCDVFCEKGVFSAEESRRILLTGRQYGLLPKIHADEIEAIGGSELAGEIGAVSAEHLIVCPDEGIASMAKGGTIACLLPATSFYLGATFAPAKKMIEAGVPVAIATDFNPGSTPNLSLQLAMNIACYRYRMTPEETLTAATLNAAAAIGRADRVGTVETGKQADLLLWNADNLNYIFYRYGSNLVKTVVKAGQVVKQN